MEKLNDQDVSKKDKVVPDNYDSKLFSALKKEGIGYLRVLKASKFEEDSESMQGIAATVEKYLNFYVEKCLKVKGNEKLSYEKIEANVQGFMETYKSLVETKRKILHSGEEDKKFASSMKTKISEVKKYKYTQKSHKEGHSRNPYINDDLGV